MKRWPTEPVQPQTPIVMLERCERRDGGVIFVEACVQDQLKERDVPHFLLGKLGAILSYVRA
jgi:hypothetical protein